MLLVVEAGQARPGESRRLPLVGERLTIGRSAENDLRLDDHFASRRHAELRRTTLGWELLDRHSKAGTIVNGRRIESPTLLTEGDEIKIGRTRLTFVDETDDEMSVSLSESEPDTKVRHAARIEPSLETRVLLEAARAIASDSSTQAVLRSLLELGLDATDADRGLVALIDDRGRPVIEAIVVRAGCTEIEISRSVLARVFDNGESVILEEVRASESATTLDRHDIRSVICTPIGGSEIAAGIFYLDSIGHRAAFDPSHVAVVATLASLAGVVLNSATARREAMRRREIETQLIAAAEIQRTLLPPADPVPPPGFCAAAYQEMCHACGGDFFDFFRHGAGYGASLADVAGKRLDAALIMARLHAEWTGIRAAHRSSSSWLDALNRKMTVGLPANRFITVAFALIDPARGSLVYGSAGHSPALVSHRGEVARLMPTGPAIGLMDKAEFTIVEVPFEAGDRVLLFSDGLIDQQSPEGEEFGDERLRKLLRDHAQGRPGELRAKILGALQGHCRQAPQDDDITLAIVGRDD